MENSNNRNTEQLLNEIDSLKAKIISLEKYETENKSALKELVKAKEKANESDRLKAAFLSNMSHEIRTPMNGILGFVYLLKDFNLTDEEYAEYLDIIKESGDRLLSTINDLIDVSLIEAGLMEIAISEMKVNKQIQKIYSRFKPEAEEKGLKLFISNTTPEDEVIIKTDIGKVNNILIKLVKNAIKFSDDGSIEFGYSINNNELEFYVKDHGIGIPENRQKVIFDRFVQADDYETRQYEGVGLGLSICKAYVEMLGGEIRVESEEGKGSQFYFTIPYEAAGKEINKNIESESKIIPHLKTKKLKILIAEDDDAAALYLSILLKDIDKEIIHANTGTEVIKKYQDNPDIDLILMDIKMPEMNGYEVTRHIRQFDGKVVIVAQTAHTLSGDREKALESGCNEYISKPINKEELLKIINKYYNIY